jgi:Cu/Ag efflux pump CusA
MRDEVTAKVKMPEGYFITFEGEFQAQKEATQRIAIFTLVILAVIAFLLYGYFRTPFFALQVLCDIPLALVGGLVFTYFKLNNISIATLVGFIAVAGVAARNSIMLISHYLHLMQHEGEGFTKKMVIRGTKERIVPVLMTALAAGIGSSRSCSRRINRARKSCTPSPSSSSVDSFPPPFSSFLCGR